MKQAEYEVLQEALRKKLHRPFGQCYMSVNKESIYREGIKAAMSILSSHQNHQKKNGGKP